MRLQRSDACYARARVIGVICMGRLDLLKAFLLGSTSLVVFFLIAASYLLGDGFRDYPKYCAGFIPYLESIKSQSGSYPESLDSIKEISNSFRYKRKECFYTKYENEYELVTKNGFAGIAGYESKTKKWFYD